MFMMSSVVTQLQDSDGKKTYISRLRALLGFNIYTPIFLVSFCYVPGTDE